MNSDKQHHITNDIYFAKKHEIHTLLYCIIGCVIVFILHFETFIGKKLIPYDAITDYYPWYINALKSFRIDPLLSFNPYKLGGMPNFHLFAAYDIIYWLILLTPWVPNLFEHQVLSLAHLFLIPISLVLLGHLYKLQGLRVVILLVVATVAGYVGPILAYMQHLNALDSYCWGFVAIAALEYFRKCGTFKSAVILVIGLVFAFIRFPASAVFWPLFLIPYGILYCKEILSTRRKVIFLTSALIIGIIMIAPCLIQMRHIYETIDASIDVEVNNTLNLQDIIPMLGLPINYLSIIAIPGVIWVTFLSESLKQPIKHMAFYWSLSCVGLLYSFAQLTPFGDLFRIIYPPASLFRRPYAILYVLLPIIFFIAIRSLQRDKLNIPQKLKIVLSIAMALLTINNIKAYSEYALVSTICGGGTILALWQVNRRVLISLLLIMQWLGICYLPFIQSSWAPIVVSAASDPLNIYDGILPSLKAIDPHTNLPFRTIAIGLPAEFGAYASVFDYYSVGADYSTIFPRQLLLKTGIRSMHAAKIVASVIENPAVIGSSAMKQLSVRYYIFSPESYARIRPLLSFKTSKLQDVPSSSYWKIVEDTDYQPFVTALDTSGHFLQAIPSIINQGDIIFTSPSTTSIVDFGYIYDSWWSLQDLHGEEDSKYIYSDKGQLSVNVIKLNNKQLLLHYGNKIFEASLLISITTSTLLFIVGCAWLIRGVMQITIFFWYYRKLKNSL